MSNIVRSGTNYDFVLARYQDTRAGCAYFRGATSAWPVNYLKLRSRYESEYIKGDRSKWRRVISAGTRGPRICRPASHIVPPIHKLSDAARLARARARGPKSSSHAADDTRHALTIAKPGFPCGLAFTTGLRNVGESRRRTISRQSELIGRADSIAGSNSYSVIKMAAAPLRVAPAASE